MLLALLILSSLAAIFWLFVQLLPAQRQSAKFVYNVGDSPAKLNGLFPGDDVTAEYAGDPAVGEWPSVTVIVPGRNEGHILPTTLGSICEMDYPNVRIVFIDDQSTDNTREVTDKLILRHQNLRIIHNTRPPEDGWIGKTWAVHQAEPYMHDSEYLLFTDSDLVFHPQCLTQMIRLALHRRTDIASCLPSLEYHSLGELLGILPAMVLINLRLSLYASNNPRRPEALVAGGFMLARRTSYESLGGHAAVRGQVIEDIALGKTAKSKGFRIFTACTQTLFTARMYEGSLDAYRGLKKNAYAGINYNPLLIAPTLIVFMVAGILVPFYLLLGLFFWITMPGVLTFALALTAILAGVFLLNAGGQGAAILGVPKRVALWLPAGFAFYFAVLIGSIKDFYTGGNEWAGRKIASRKVQSLADVVNDK
ncbi:MAG TPA: glycosyltransferase family 2 protein [Phycisphaerae bacterium]|nr:glycosyltransferase family 2 protein [Phycisphaerae bacterium]